MENLKKSTLKLFAALLAVLILTTGMIIPASAYSTSHPNTWVNTGNQIEDLIGVAMTQVGYHGIEYSTGTKYGAWYGNTLAPWCGMFISWCANQAGIPTSVIVRSARAIDFKLTGTGTYHYKDGYTPKRGDLVLYNPTSGSGYYWPSKNSDGTYSKASHVAIVCSYDANTGKIWVVHGNATDNKVCYNSISVSKTAIQAFVTPNYTTGPAVDVPQSDFINGSAVRLRSAPEINANNIVTTLNVGTHITVLNTVTDAEGDIWYQVKVTATGAVGYVFGEYVTIVTPSGGTATPSDTINGDGVRLRSEPNTSNSANIITTLNSGQVVTLLSSTTDSDGDIWYQVSLTKDGQNYTGYVYGEYVNVVNPPSNKPDDDQTPTQDTINSDQVRLRLEPSINATIIEYLDTDQVVNILDTVMDADGDTWYHISLTKDSVQHTGYVFGELVNVGSISASAKFTYNLESPEAKASVDPSECDTLSVNGWVFSNLGESVLYAKIDDGSFVLLEKKERPDVKAAYPTECTTDNAGFAHNFDISALSFGDHTIDIYASSGAVFEKVLTASFTLQDLTMPTGSQLSVTDISADGFTVSITATDKYGIKQVEFPTWTLGDEQDDLIWLNSTSQNENTYTCRINTSSFTTANDTYIVHIYATDNNNNKTCIQTLSINPATYTPCRIVYDANGGSSSPSTQTAEFGQSLTVSADKPTRDGYRFMGWAKTATATTAEISEGYVHSQQTTLTLYAVWSKALTTGDANDDGSIDTVDLAIIKKYLAGITPEISSKADTNQDGKIDLSDLVILKKYLAGL